VSGLDSPLGELDGDTADFLDRPADQERRFFGREVAALGGLEKLRPTVGYQGIASK
jgi:hypothetical protein